jgi:GT2 family glycosyltransferase
MIPGQNRAPKHKPEIGIIILNWNHPEDTIRCLESLNHSSYTNYKIVIVDNGSCDRARLDLRKSLGGSGNFERPSRRVTIDQHIVDEYRIDHLTLLENPQNLGYTGGNNLGIKYLLSLTDQDDLLQSSEWGEPPVDYFLLLNDDVVVETSSLGKLILAAVEHPEVGFLGPKIMSIEEPEVLLSAGGILDTSFRPQNRGLGELDRGQFDQSPEVDYLSGCALLVKKAVIEQIGLLDDDYFAYHEEIDWCYRGRQGGFISRLVPTAHAFHPDTRRRDQNSPSVTYYTTRNDLLFARKHKLVRRVFNQLLFEDIRQLLSWSLKTKWRVKRAQRNALASALIDFTLQKRGRWSKF